jgi:hypothetical protein
MWTAATTDVFAEWFQTLGDEERAEIEAKVNLNFSPKRYTTYKVILSKTILIISLFLRQEF